VLGGCIDVESAFHDYNPYSPAVLTGHVLWDDQVYQGGIIGGDYGSVSYVGYTSNVATTVTHVIMEGRLYVNTPNSINSFTCYDLKTGRKLYNATGTISWGFHIPGNAFAQSVSSRGGIETQTILASSYGASPTGYLLGTSSGPTNSKGYPTSNWNFYDPMTGKLLRTITNVTATVYDLIDGTDLCWGATYINMTSTEFIYSKSFLWQWNMTKVVGNDWWTGVMWTKTANNPATGLFGPGDGTGRSCFAVSNDLSTIVWGGAQGCFSAYGFSTADGRSLWNTTLGYISMNDVSNNFLWGTNYWMGIEPEKNTFHCYSMLTGAEVWKTTLPSSGNDAWDNKAHYATPINDLKNYYFLSPSGTVVALDIATGSVVWKSKPQSDSGETVFNAPSLGWRGHSRRSSIRIQWVRHYLPIEPNSKICSAASH